MRFAQSALHDAAVSLHTRLFVSEGKSREQTGRPMFDLVFSDTLRTRVQQSGRVGLELYGLGHDRFVGDALLARGFESLRNALPSDRLALVEAKRGNSYGAWNPTILFLGLSAGSKPPPRPLIHQHTIGCPGFFEREPGARGIWLARTVKELTVGAFSELAARPGFEWLRDWRTERPAEFIAGVGGAAAVLNFSLEAVRIGGRVTFDATRARNTLVAWLHAFRPTVVVTLKPDVSKELVEMFPACGLASHRTHSNDAVRTMTAQFDRIVIPTITMPIHPTAMGQGINRMKASKPHISRAIADVLAHVEMRQSP
jgi:hypothetical protein